MILDEIIKAKKKEIQGLKKKFKKPLKQSEMPILRDFMAAISKPGMNLIAETKAASPSAGVIVKKYSPEKIAAIYEKAGAAAISVLTEKAHFKGSLDDIKKVKKSVKLPVLRKDFIIDEAQVYEARLAGADAVLLIARILEQGELERLIRTSSDLGMTAVVEVHSVKEAKDALDADARVIGINNRDLNTLKVDLSNTVNIISQLPQLKQRVLISESGISERSQIDLLKEIGVNAVLIGEALLKSEDIPGKIEELIS